ncbi:MAG: hypothetical protein Q7K42_00310 [Candidatus Diapherotrites archaeon]|nr:hypothetical protein [Candidatus Diapherotrites archaeon]
MYKPRKPVDINRIMGMHRSIERNKGTKREPQNIMPKPVKRTLKIRNKIIKLTKFFTELKGQSVSKYISRFFAAAFEEKFHIFLGPDPHDTFRPMEKPRILENGQYALKVGLGDVDKQPVTFGEIIFSRRAEQFIIEDFKTIN